MDLLPQCLSCSHFRSPLASDAPPQTCDAFPKHIPDPIWGDVVDHREPYPGDHGIQWEASPGQTYPEWVLKIGSELAKK
jgi:hypothetical protein